MTAPDPIYTSDNCNFAFQLRWGITIFWQHPVVDSLWFADFEEALKKDGIRILSWRWLADDAMQFAVSTLPTASPIFIIQRIKGRIQFAVREHAPKALRAHYAVRSYGTQEREIIEAYIAKQPSKHLMAAQRSQKLFEELAFVDADVDLSVSQRTEHGDIWYNLHVVLVHVDRWCDVDAERLKRTLNVIQRCAKQKAWRLSRCSILADHLHLALGCQVTDSPQQVALALMNNVAWVYGMTTILCHSAFIGTFGEYDQRAIEGERSHR
jgi:REP element-mobilizing transposase RayT